MYDENTFTGRYIGSICFSFSMHKTLCKHPAPGKVRMTDTNPRYQSGDEVQNFLVCRVEDIRTWNGQYR